MEVLMKKFLVVFLAIFLTAGFVMAQDEGIGLTAGVEFGIEGVNKPNDAEDMYPYLMPMVWYGNSFGAFDLYAELDYTLGFTKDDGDLPQDLWFDLALGYNLGLGSSPTLSFLLENELDITFAPLYGGDMGDFFWGILRPGICFNQNVESAGDFYAQVDLPIGYGKGFGDDTVIGLDIALGWGSNFGLGFKAKAHMLLAPSEAETGYTGIDLKASYENGPFYGEIEFRIAKDEYGTSSALDGSGKKAGFAIIPKFQYTIIQNLNIYAFCAFGNIGGDGDVKITPALGITYSF